MELETDLLETSRRIYCREFDAAERKVKWLIEGVRSDVEVFEIMEKHVERLEHLHAEMERRNEAIRRWSLKAVIQSIRAADS